MPKKITKISLVFILGIFLTNLTFGQNRPNIVWITSEDNSKHYLSLYDENGVNTPNIAALAEKGLIYDHAFSNAPVCSVARSTLISGCYAPRVGAEFHRELKKVPLPNELKMFPTYLREAGYYTTNNSKEDYNFIKNEGVWDDSSNKASYKNREDGQPFFHVYNIASTHEGSLHFGEKAMQNEPLSELPNPKELDPHHPKTDLFEYTRARYLSKIQGMDQKVGELVAELEKEGLLDDTFIFYYGDHGGVMPGSKGYLYETGLHVPLVIHIPENFREMVTYPQGSRVKEFVSFVDFGPTVLQLAGVDIPKEMDGRPFLGLKKAYKENKAYGYADRFDEKYDLVRSLRKGKYKYIRNYQPFNFDGLMNNYRYKQMAYKEWWELYKKGELNETQAAFFEGKPVEVLYDLENDPYETHNLANDPMYKEVLLDLRKDLQKWVKEMPDLSFYPEFYLIKNAFDNPVEFGKQHQSDIKSYVDIADLSLEEYQNVDKSIKKALSDNDPWKRYWGIIVASSFGKEALGLKDTIDLMASNDPEMMVRVRALEFLGLNGLANPVEEMTKALYQSNDGTEALLIMNSIVLMQDGEHQYKFEIDSNKISEEVKENEEAQRRLLYLTSGS
ncbi:sulfatase family protein [Echinicola shivajiensis]|uniref:sulfatase family protein n=1 Tax=Echinicola shivajiensis TaxID=1035916 RepID=UPI001BFC8F25|nr:sulfatase [Echinicola shivajiensis]